MATGIVTTVGEQYINAQAGALGALTLRVGTSRKNATQGVTQLQAQYLLNGSPHEIDLQDGGAVLNADGDIIGFSFLAIDNAATATYQMREFGVFNASDQLIAYVSADTGETALQFKAVNGTLSIRVVLSASGITAPTISVTSTIDGLGTATTTEGGAVRLATDADTTSTGAVVKSPSQIQAMITASLPSAATPATTTQINAGTDNAAPVTSLGLEGSQYKRVIQQTQAEYDAIATKDDDVLYAIVG